MIEQRPNLSRLIMFDNLRANRFVWRLAGCGAWQKCVLGKPVNPKCGLRVESCVGNRHDTVTAKKHPGHHILYYCTYWCTTRRPVRLSECYSSYTTYCTRYSTTVYTTGYPCKRRCTVGSCTVLVLYTAVAVVGVWLVGTPERCTMVQ